MYRFEVFSFCLVLAKFGVEFITTGMDLKMISFTLVANNHCLILTQTGWLSYKHILTITRASLKVFFVNILGFLLRRSAK